MKRYIIFILVLTGALLFSSTLQAEVSFNKQTQLWSELVEAKKDSFSHKFDQWKIIEGIRLINKVEDVSLKAVTLATIIRYYDRKEHIWQGKDISEEQFLAWARKKKLTEAETKEFGAKLGQHLFGLYKERDDTWGKYKKEDPPLGVTDSRVMEQYLERNKNDIVGTVRDFAMNRALDVEIIVREDFRFDEITSFIDNQNPIILQSPATDNYLICVGYIKRGAEEYLITSDPHRIMHRDVSHAYFVRGTSEGAREERERAKGKDAKHGLIKIDMEFQVEGDRQQGITITDWNPGKYIGYVIRGFKVTESSISNQYRILMEKKK